MASQEVLRGYLEAAAERLKKAIMQALDSDPQINQIVADLRSLGVVAVIDQQLSVKCYVHRSFVPPSDLEHLSGEKLNEIVSDQEFDRWFNNKA